MSHVICIAGESGTGKTTSMRNLDPNTTLYIDCDKKGLSWRGWKQQFNGEKKNYLVTDFPQVALQALRKVNEQDSMKHIRVVVVDTLNGLMVADEMRRTKEKGYDKWQDLAQSIYDLVDYSLTMRDDVTVVFVAHTQTDHDDNGYMFTRIKTSGRKLDKITLESKFSTVLISKCIDGRYVFETQANFSTAKSPMGAFQEKEIDNDITAVIEALKDY
ncbi:MAG TPA: ATP-binding protein [Candidatus Eisenbergiella merdipullorum]|uniref:ATP-binding protein n=1 Tax=Candidatus Eisenbergiella merdipullorum TaxID=2838553 RepID=A0A9D2I5S9_9FIRM|nr:ATP-binding protein [Candidatus Eisenbergiella merdipullorum]